VENALKHNAATRQEPLIINVSIKDDYIIVENARHPKMQLEHSSKLGLKNLRERVKLILQKEVIVSESDELFIVKIPLKSIK
jgi:sensor histidine kinase YesM